MEVSRKIIVCLLMIITMGYSITEGREPMLHRVGGGRFTWKPKVNFTNWTSNERFYKGDWLCKILHQFSYPSWSIMSLIFIFCHSKNNVNN